MSHSSILFDLIFISSSKVIVFIFSLYVEDLNFVLSNEFVAFKVLYSFITGVGTYCVFDGEDINALDWEVVDSDYSPYHV